MVGAAYRPNAQLTANGVPFEEMLKMANVGGLVANGSTNPSFEDPKAKQYSLHSYGAHFAEVEWEPEIARLRVSRIFSIFDCGRIINKGAGTNQILGAAVMGVGMALFEEHASTTPHRPADQRQLRRLHRRHLRRSARISTSRSSTIPTDRERVRRARHRRDRHGRRGAGDYGGGLSRHRRPRARAADAHRRSAEVEDSRSLNVLESTSTISTKGRQA